MADDYKVDLAQVFHGPMDLLLHLVKEQEVEIQEVKLAQVVDGYLAYLKQLEALDIEVAGDFLVIAATLMAIKSRSLLPRDEVEVDDDLDPEDELIQRLLEYRRFRGAADDLEDRLHRRSLEHERGFKGEVRLNEPEKSLDMGEVTAWDLLAAFSRLMRETLAGRPHRIKGDPRPLRWYVHILGNLIRDRGRVHLSALLTEIDEEPTREGLIGSFCALLELVKIGLVTARQDQPTDEIDIEFIADSAVDFEDLIRASRFMDEDDVDDGLTSSPTPPPAPEVAWEPVDDAWESDDDEPEAWQPEATVSEHDDDEWAPEADEELEASQPTAAPPAPREEAWASRDDEEPEAWQSEAAAADPAYDAWEPEADEDADAEASS